MTEYFKVISWNILNEYNQVKYPFNNPEISVLFPNGHLRDQGVLKQIETFMIRNNPHAICLQEVNEHLIFPLNILCTMYGYLTFATKNGTSDDWVKEGSHVDSYGSSNTQNFNVTLLTESLNENNNVVLKEMKDDDERGVQILYFRNINFVLVNIHLPSLRFKNTEAMNLLYRLSSVLSSTKRFFIVGDMNIDAMRLQYTWNGIAQRFSDVVFHTKKPTRIGYIDSLLQLESLDHGIGRGIVPEIAFSSSFNYGTYPSLLNPASLYLSDHLAVEFLFKIII